MALTLGLAIAAPDVARADSLVWSPPIVGPSNPYIGDSQVPLASALNAVSLVDSANGWAVGLRVNNVYTGGGTKAGLLARTVNGGASWSWSQFGSYELHGVVARSSTDAWAVGDNGTLLHFTNNAWSSVTIAGWPTTKHLRAIAFSGSTGWAVGDSLGVVCTTNGGANWSVITLPGSGATLRSVAVSGPGTAIAVGDGGTMRVLSATASSSRYSGTTSTLNGVTFSDSSHGWAVGDLATFVTTLNGGLTWTRFAPASVPIPFGYTASSFKLRSVAFADAADGIAVGDYQGPDGVYQGVWRTSNGGGTWTVMRLEDGGLGSYQMKGIAFAPGDADRPVVVGRPPASTLTQDSEKARAYRGTWSSRTDVTPPTTTSNVQGAYVGPATITLTATDTESGVAHTYWKLDGGVQHEGTSISVSTAGAHDIEFWSVDAAPASNTETPHKTAHFTVTPPDVTPPVTTSDRVPSYEGPATIHLTPSDGAGGSGVAYTYFVLDGAAAVEGLTVVASTAGTHTLEFWSVDVASNPESPHKTTSFEVTIPDTTPPTTSSDAVLHYDSTATIHLTATDNAGGSEVAHTYWKLDGLPQQEGLTVVVPVEGAHSLEFWSVDVAGNRETTHTINFAVAVPAPVDTTKPVTVSDAVASYSGPATIRLIASDVGGSGVAHTYWKLDGGVKTEGLTVVVPAAGAHDLEFWSEDVALNIETHHHALFSVVIPDTIAPVTDSDAKPSYLWTATINLTATDAGGSGVAHTYWKLDGGAQVEGNLIVTTVAGSHTLEFWSEDAAAPTHNRETPHKTATFTVTAPQPSADTMPPVTTWPGWKSTYVTKASIVLVAADGDGTGVAQTWWSFDGGDPRQGTVLSTTKAGYHTLEYWSVDKAIPVNTEVKQHLHFTVLTATRLSITSNRTSVLHRHAVTLSGIITPNVLARTRVEVWVLRPGSHAYTRLTTRYNYAYHHWSYTYYPATKGTWYFKVKLPQTARYASSESTYRRITVK